jgi:hypothetical protein
LLLVEGESDALTAWHYGLPCLGIPGNQFAGIIAAEHVAPLKTIYIWQEHGKGGSVFVASITRQLRKVGFAGRIIVIYSPMAKDCSDLHTLAPEKFIDRFREMLSTGHDAPEPEPTPEPRPQATRQMMPSGLQTDHWRARRELIDLRALIARDTSSDADRSGKYASPFNAGKRSLSVAPDGIHWRDWVTGDRGDVIDWEMKLRGVSHREAREILGLTAPQAVRINPSAQANKPTRDNSDKRAQSFHERVGSTDCKQPVPAYFKGCGADNQNARMAGVHRCGSPDCPHCHNAWQRDQISHFVEAPHATAETPVLVDHHQQFGGSFYSAVIERAQLATITRRINRAKNREGVDPDSVQYLAIQCAHNPERITLIATVEFPESTPLTLSQVRSAAGEAILAIESTMREDRNRPVTNSRGWTREKVRNWELIARPTSAQLQELRDEVWELEQEGVVHSVKLCRVDGNPMTRFEVADDFDDTSLLLKVGIFTDELVGLVGWRGRGDDPTSEPCLRKTPPPRPIQQLLPGCK